MDKRVSLEAMLDRLSPDHRSTVEARGETIIAEEFTRRALRQARGETQRSLAAKLGINQENVSRIERRSDIMISTLSDYLASMGGKLTLLVEFEGRPPVKITGFDLGEPAEADPAE